MSTKSRKPHATKILSLFCLALLLFAGIMAGTASAQNYDKKSDKLKKKMTQVGADGYIDVIVSPTMAWTNSLTTALNGKAAVLKKSYGSFSFKVYKIKQKDIDSILSRTNVGYLMVDDTVKTLGHMTPTTGISTIRNLNGSSNPVDGTGVGVVIVDSGIDQNHTSLKGRV